MGLKYVTQGQKPSARNFNNLIEDVEGLKQESMPAGPKHSFWAIITGVDATTTPYRYAFSQLQEDDGSDPFVVKPGGLEGTTSVDYAVEVANSLVANGSIVWIEPHNSGVWRFQAGGSSGGIKHGYTDADLLSGTSALVSVWSTTDTGINVLVNNLYSGDVAADTWVYFAWIADADRWELVGADCE